MYIRLYNEDGEHVLSIVDEPELCNEIDLATPNGMVQYCGVPRDLFKVMCDYFKVCTDSEEI